MRVLSGGGSALKGSSSSADDTAIASVELLEVGSTDGFSEKRLKTPVNLGYLEGHWPYRPLVPAAVQVQWGMDVVRELLGSSCSERRSRDIREITPARTGLPVEGRAVTGARRTRVPALGGEPPVFFRRMSPRANNQGNYG